MSIEHNEQQTAAAQEPIGYRWRHSASEAWQYSNFPCGWEHQPLYAAPVTAAPVSVTRDADGEIVMVKQGDTIIASTCHAGGKAHAAPGIDLVSDILTDLSNVAASWVVEAAGTAANAQNECAMQMHDAIERWSNRLRLDDASPKGDEAQQAGAQAIAIAHMDGYRWNGKHWQKDSPKGSSDAVTALAAFNDVLSPNLRVPNTITYQIAMLAALQASDAEVRP